MNVMAQPNLLIILLFEIMRRCISDGQNPKTETLIIINKKKNEASTKLVLKNVAEAKEFRKKDK